MWVNKQLLQISSFFNVGNNQLYKLEISLELKSTYQLRAQAQSKNLKVVYGIVL